jgi:hypothetical protein
MQVSKLIYSAMRICGLLGAPGRAPSDSETEDGLMTLNGMLDAWITEKLLVFCVRPFQVQLVVSQQDYTIGEDGTPDFAHVRPEQIDRAGLILNNVTPSTEIPLQVYTDQEWAAVTPKALQSTQPTGLWYQRTVPNGICTFWPIPQNPYQVNLYLWEQLAQVVDASVNIDLPPGYQSAIEYNLAMELATRFKDRAKLSPWDVQKAMLTKSTVKTMNDERLRMRVEYAALGTAGRRGRYQILSNTYYGGGN